MTKSLFIGALVITGIAFSTDNAFAGRRRCCCQVQQTACGAAQTMAPQSYETAPNPQTAPAPPTEATTPQANAGTGYQSFSFEPGSSVVNAGVIAPAPVMQTRNSGTSFYGQIRGDRKARGAY